MAGYELPRTPHKHCPISLLWPGAGADHGYYIGLSPPAPHVFTSTKITEYHTQNIRAARLTI